jgi:hypothetical protein
MTTHDDDNVSAINFLNDTLGKHHIALSQLSKDLLKHTEFNALDFGLPAAELWHVMRLQGELFHAICERHREHLGLTPNDKEIAPLLELNDAFADEYHIDRLYKIQESVDSMKRLIEAAPPQTDQFTQRTAREKLAAQLVPAFKADEMHYSGAVAREVSRIVESYNYFAERNRKKCDPETQAMVADAQQLGQLIIQRANDLTASCKQSLDVLKGSARA